MANPNGGIMMTLLAAANEAAGYLRYKNAFVRRMYWDNQPIVGIPYQTLTVIVPTVNEGAVVDIGAGPIQPVDYAYNTVPITLDSNLSVTNVFKDWDQARTPRVLRDFFKVNFEALYRKINRKAVGYLNASNFPNYTLFTGTGTLANQITRPDISAAWVNLAQVGVPMEDYDNVSLMLTTPSYGEMIADPNFLTQYIVGDKEAMDVQQRARLQTLYGADIFYDQMMPNFNSGHQGAALLHRYALAGVTARSPQGGPNVEETTFFLGGDEPTGEGGAMSGSSGGPGGDQGATGIPVRIQASYSHYDQGWVVSMNALCGIAVARPEMGSLFQSAM
jgi:hypothetical protein